MIRLVVTAALLNDMLLYLLRMKGNRSAVHDSVFSQNQVRRMRGRQQTLMMMTVLEELVRVQHCNMA